MCANSYVRYQYVMKYRLVQQPFEIFVWLSWDRLHDEVKLILMLKTRTKNKLMNYIINSELFQKKSDYCNFVTFKVHETLKCEDSCSILHLILVFIMSGIVLHISTKHTRQTYILSNKTLSYYSCPCSFKHKSKEYGNKLYIWIVYFLML